MHKVFEVTPEEVSDGMDEEGGGGGPGVTERRQRAVMGKA